MADLVYFETRATKYVDSWPNVPAVFAPIGERLLQAGVLRSFTGTNSGDQHHSTLTPIGEMVVFYFQGMSFNYATVNMVLDLWPLSRLLNRDPVATNFLKLFMLDWNDQDVRGYLSKRTEEIRFTGLKPGMLHPFTGVRADSIASLLNLTPYDIIEEDFLPEEEEPDFGTVEDHIEKAVFELELEEKVAVEVNRVMNILANPKCEYCEGTGVDPFEDGQMCPQCATTIDARVNTFEMKGEVSSTSSDSDWDIL